MLRDIASYVTHFADVIATVTGIDIEVADAELVRVAGTGRYAEGVGRSIEHASALYRAALRRRETLCIENFDADVFVWKLFHSPSLETVVIHRPGEPDAVIDLTVVPEGEMPAEPETH